MHFYCIAYVHFIKIKLTQMVYTTYNVMHSKRNGIGVFGGLTSFFSLCISHSFTVIEENPFLQLMSPFCDIAIGSLRKQVCGINIGTPGVPDFSDHFKSSCRTSKTSRLI